MTHLLLDIKLREEDFAEDAEMDLRDELVEAIEGRGIGEVGGFGSGDGSMDISVIVEDEAVGRERVTALMGELAPDMAFTIEVLPDDEEAAE
jgi:hypothetical protein